MRLINTQTHHLEEFFHNIPPYAILSHTWDGEEVNFQEYLLAIGPDANKYAHVRRKAGFSKIIGACIHAQRDRLNYVWCDTNCIDKTSSAELSEAINSMYSWYRDSVVCYAFLADVDTGVGTNADFAKRSGPFAKSRWFTRGWTLQELLAPPKVIFIDKLWRILGDRAQLAQVICEVTRIHIGALHNRDTVPEYSIAQRMSWAADRQTSRQEDIAYCLIGVFGINMPLLYGEGNKAFIRLQQEIIKVSDDQSILAWDCRGSQNQILWTGALSDTPAHFQSCGSIVRDIEVHRGPHSITNLGILMNAPILRTRRPGIFLVGLNCSKELRIKDLPISSLHGSRHYGWQLRIWLVMYNWDHENFLRGHYPASSITLHELYPVKSTLTSAQIFLSLDLPRLSMLPVKANPTSLQLARSPIHSSGFTVIVGAGKMVREDRTLLEKSYPLAVECITTLRPRGRQTISHELVSSGNFSIVLSAFWDEKMRPTNWLYTIIFDPEMKIISRIMEQREWHCLFHIVSHPAGCCSSAKDMNLLHERLRKLQPTKELAAQEDILPLVSISKTPLQDLHGYLELVADVVFRELVEIRAY
ncbi:hypothetical protein O1611_g2416 [Lasiodiplodia mahajangana]|uniref:Uncharacterized protein n=1 Tax=Lasiodiplodia mahajangana TaxID=1108764 RepID=A0ACC2JVH5_9PEZI|nr:hypothetical protein O1611_g2416 [Lasiodiplodia mahajangana]